MDRRLPANAGIRTTTNETRRREMRPDADRIDGTQVSRRLA